MNWFFEFITNPYLIAPIAAWFVAQNLKVIIDTVINKKFDPNRFFGDGGMPSCHSATVSALACICGLGQGFGSVEFALSAIFCAVVCRDAMGVRMETGKQAIVLNEFIKLFGKHSEKKLSSIKLKEFVGHTPLQVGAGIIIGVGVSVEVYFIFGNFGAI